MTSSRMRQNALFWHVSFVFLMVFVSPVYSSGSSESTEQERVEGMVPVAAASVVPTEPPTLRPVQQVETLYKDFLAAERRPQEFLTDESVGTELERIFAQNKVVLTEDAPEVLALELSRRFLGTEAVTFSSPPVSHSPKAKIFLVTMIGETQPRWVLKILRETAAARTESLIAKEAVIPLPYMCALLASNFHLRQILPAKYSVCSLQEIGIFERENVKGSWAIMPYTPTLTLKSLIKECFAPGEWSRKYELQDELEKPFIQFGKMLAAIHRRTLNHGAQEGRAAVREYLEQLVQEHEVRLSYPIKCEEGWYPLPIVENLRAALREALEFYRIWVQETDWSDVLVSCVHADANLGNFIYDIDDGSFTVIDNQGFLNSVLGYATTGPRRLIGKGTPFEDLGKVLTDLLVLTQVSIEDPKSVQRLMKWRDYIFGAYVEKSNFSQAELDKGQHIMNMVILGRLLSRMRTGYDERYADPARYRATITKAAQWYLSSLERGASQEVGDSSNSANS